MYYASRAEAGKELAEKLKVYKSKPTVILALTSGAVLIGEQIAKVIHAPLMMLLLKDIVVPGDKSVLGTIDQQGGFTYNSMFSAGEIEEFTTEYHNYFDMEKFEKFHEINEILGKGGLIDREALRHKNIILVTDGSSNGMAFEAAAEFLKSIKIARIISAVPVAAVPAVDKLHVISDEMQVLAVTENYLDTDHYYETNDLPDEDQTLKIINQFSHEGS